MGIINVTPDSFSDGGKFYSTENALTHGLTLIDEGADVLDVGGESTRPQADMIDIQEELDRVIPLIEQLTGATETPISIDTSKPEVMRAAVAAGAQMINDVNGLRRDGALMAVSEAAVPVCVMHMQGNPKNMQSEPTYNDVVTDVIDFYQERIKACAVAGIKHSDILLDPGVGFGKSLNHNLLLLQNLAKMKAVTNCEMLIGASRKSLIQEQLGRNVNERLPASLGLAVQAVLNGVKIVRTHDVRATHDAIRMVEAVRYA